MEKKPTAVDDLTFRNLIEYITKELELQVNDKPAEQHLRESAVCLTLSYVEAHTLLFGRDRPPAWQLSADRHIEVARPPKLADVMVITGLARWCASDECPHNDLGKLSVMEISSFSWLRTLSPETFSNLLEPPSPVANPILQEQDL